MSTACGGGITTSTPRAEDLAVSTAMHMSMWMPAAGQTWFGAATSFLLHWIVMMAAMMLPSIAPTLWQIGRAMDERRRTRIAWMLTTVAVAYLGVWTVIGAALFPIGAAINELEMRHPLVSRAAPALTVFLLIASVALHFSPWKARHLACVLSLPRQTRLARARAAWTLGLRLGAHCSQCSAGLMGLMLALGMMSVTVMSILTIAMMIERLAPTLAHMMAVNRKTIAEQFCSTRGSSDRDSRRSHPDRVLRTQT